MQKKYSEFLHSADKFYNFQYFDTLAKHSPVNSKKCTAILSFLIKKKKMRIGFKIVENIISYLDIHVTQFSVEISALPVNFQVQCIEVQPDIQLKEKNLIMSLYQAFVRPFLPEKNIPSFTITPSSCHRILAVHTFVNNFPRMKHMKSYIRSKVSDEELENSLRIATTSIEPD